MLRKRHVRMSCSQPHSQKVGYRRVVFLLAEKFTGNCEIACWDLLYYVPFWSPLQKWNNAYWFLLGLWHFFINGISVRVYTYICHTLQSHHEPGKRCFCLVFVFFPYGCRIKAEQGSCCVIYSVLYKKSVAEAGVEPGLVTLRLFIEQRSVVFFHTHH